MILDKEIENLIEIKNNIQAHPIVKSKLNEIGEVLTDINNILSIKDNGFNLKRLQNKVYLCYNNIDLCVLTKKQVTSIERIMNR